LLSERLYEIEILVSYVGYTTTAVVQPYSAAAVQNAKLDTKKHITRINSIIVICSCSSIVAIAAIV
jgi:hypothetical protein